MVENLMCDECGKEIRSKDDLIIFGGNMAMAFLKKVHRDCYSNAKPATPYWFTKPPFVIKMIKIPVNNRVATFISIASFFLMMSFLFFKDVPALVKPLIPVIALMFPLYRYYVWYKFEKRYT